MKIERHFDLRTHRLAHSPHPRYSRQDSAIGIDCRHRRAGVHFKSPGTLRYNLRRFFGRGRCRIVIASSPPVNLYLVANLPAEQTVDRLTKEFSADIPKSHLDAAQSAHEMRPAMIKGFVVVAANQALDIRCVLAHEPLRHVTDSSFGSAKLPFHRELSVSFQPAGSEDMEKPPSRRNLRGLDSFDSQFPRNKLVVLTQTPVIIRDRIRVARRRRLRCGATDAATLLIFNLAA